jgi:hypothetical protein
VTNMRHCVAWTMLEERSDGWKQDLDGSRFEAG